MEKNNLPLLDEVNSSNQFTSWNKIEQRSKNIRTARILLIAFSIIRTLQVQEVLFLLIRTHVHNPLKPLLAAEWKSGLYKKGTV
jgi:hypothetical protein